MEHGSHFNDAIISALSHDVVIPKIANFILIVEFLAEIFN